MKLLFISSKDVFLKKDGGDLCTNRNYTSCCRLFGKENVEIVNIKSFYKGSLMDKVHKRLNYFFGYKEGLTNKVVGEILEISKEFQFVFFDESTYGVLARRLSRSGFRGQIITYFHNVEKDVTYQLLKITPFSFLHYWMTFFNEKMAFRYSDIRIALNSRDKNRLIDLYGDLDVTLIPISLEDSFELEKDHEWTGRPPVCLFFGSSWYANVQGLEWFIENVFPSVEIKFRAVGIDSQILKKKYGSLKNLELPGYVRDLSKEIRDADCIVLPIFKGGGMKVKTCEALMYGKSIFGTSESFMGYEVDYEKAGALCNTKEAFIEALNKLKAEKRIKFNQYNRNIFLKEYSFEVTLNKFERILFPDLKKRGNLPLLSESHGL